MSQRATVLVVDDDQDTLDTMREILTEEGHGVLCASNGREGLALALAHEPDLVLLDLVMPEMDGVAFLTAAREDPRLARVHFVVLTASDATHDLPCESLRKPLRLASLLELIRRVAQAGADAESDAAPRRETP